MLRASEPRADLIGYQANLLSESHGLRRRVFKSWQTILFLMLIGLAADVWCQRIPLPSSPPVADAALPDAPESLATAPQQSPGQSSPGSIRGVVVNRDGAAYEGVRVVFAQPPSTPVSSRTVESDSNGRFSFSDAPPGAFTLTISSQGFATQVISGLLHSGESQDLPAIVLHVTTAVSEVRVTATQQEVALEQLRQEEKQRVFGFIPNFYVTYVPNAPPLTSKQKFALAWKSSVDPVTFLVTGGIAGVEQANNTFSGYGEGAQGYAKRFAANYSDTFIGTMIGGAMLPSLLKQDPRYFYKGIGTPRSRFLYAIANAIICKGDNGHWQVNYSGILGSLAAGGISNLYYPANNRDGTTLTFENALINTAAGAVQNVFQEFLVRRFTPKIPNYGSSKP
jgi:hypothetical protein